LFGIPLSVFIAPSLPDILWLNRDTGKRDSTARRPGAAPFAHRSSDCRCGYDGIIGARRETLERRDVVYGFSLQGAAIESLPDWLRDNFLVMRQRIEADRAVADIFGAE
jgi:hypothetical protein